MVVIRLLKKKNVFLMDDRGNDSRFTLSLRQLRMHVNKLTQLAHCFVSAINNKTNKQTNKNLETKLNNIMSVNERFNVISVNEKSGFSYTGFLVG